MNGRDSCEVNLNCNILLQRKACKSFDLHVVYNHYQSHIVAINTKVVHYFAVEYNVEASLEYQF